MGPSHDSSNHHPHNPTMIQRTLLRQSRVLSSSVRSAAPRTSLARPQFRPAPTALGVSRQAAIRWYSSEPEAKKDEEVKKDEKSEGEDPAKKEVEAKNKEILELKDRYLRSVAEFRNLKNEQNETCNPPKTSPSRNSPRTSSKASITSTGHLPWFRRRSSTQSRRMSI